MQIGELSGDAAINFFGKRIEFVVGAQSSFDVTKRDFGISSGKRGG